MGGLGAVYVYNILHTMSYYIFPSSSAHIFNLRCSSFLSLQSGPSTPHPPFLSLNVFDKIEEIFPSSCTNLI